MAYLSRIFLIFCAIMNVEYRRGSEFMSTIGRRIKRLRLEYQLTQKTLADKLSLTPKMISFYELGQRLPPLDIILKLANIFQVSTDYLLGNSELREGKKLSLAQKIKKLRLEYRDTPDELSRYLNIGVEEYELIERGEKSPEPEMLNLLAMCYEVPLEYLTSSSVYWEDSAELKIYKLIKELSLDEKTQIVKYIELIKKRNKKTSLQTNL